MKLTDREENLIIIAVTFLICSLILTYLILPMRDQYSEGKNKLARAEQTLAETKSAQIQATSSEKELKAVTVQLAAYRQQLPIKSESSELLFYINQAASKSGVVLERFEHLGSKNAKNDGTKASDNSKGAGVAKSENITVIPYRVRVMGNYKQIHKFLTETERLKRVTHNQRVIINEITTSNTLECLLEFDTFIKKQGSGQMEAVTDIPPIKTGRNTLFTY